MNMKLRYIALWADSYHSGYGYDGDLASDFAFNARFISNYLSKQVRKINLELEEYKMISVDLSQNGDYGAKALSENVMSVTLSCSEKDLKRYVTLSDDVERYEQYLTFLEKGYHASRCINELQISQLLQLHRQFRENDYRNEWLFKKKPIREFGIYIYFKCYFTSFEFRLELEVYDLKKNRLITKGVVMRTAPDEVCFDKDFKAISIDQKKLIVLDFLSRPSFSFDFCRLADGEFHVYYHPKEEWLKRLKEYEKDIDRLTRHPYLEK